MEQITAFHWVETIGWLASLFTVATYAMKAMMPLRILAIVSSICFLIYAAILQLWPLLGMELILLPINTYRLWQIISLRGRLTQVKDGTDADFSVVRTYGKSRRITSGSLIFKRGDPVDQLYFIGSGRILIEEIGVEMSSGDIFGEIAFFTDAATRTATARCVEEAEVYEIDKKRFMRLQFEDPSFGLSVMRTITRRLINNANRKTMPMADFNPEQPPVG